MASVGVLTAGVAHEINNPLNYIQSALYSLQNMNNGWYDDMDVSELKDLNNQIVSAMEVDVERINDIVQALERFNKKSKKDFTSCNIRIIIESCLKILASETKVRIDVITSFPDKELFFMVMKVS